MIKISSAGAKVLNHLVSCDGFYSDSSYRVQTHAHSDHTKKFASSLIHTIVATTPTLEILSHQNNIPMLMERPHVHNIGVNDFIEFEDCKIQFKDAMHMIGSVQVAIEYTNGDCIGYSGDFSAHAINNPINVDYLLVDSTYGHPESVRNFTQDQASQVLIDLIGDNFRLAPIYLKANMGTLQKSLSKINNAFHFLPILITKKELELFNIYNKNGYTLNNLHIDNPLKEDIINIKDENKYIKIYSDISELPSDTSDHISIRLSSIFHRNSGILTKHSDNHYTVSISEHADFNETIEYIKNVNPKFVYTDPSTNSKYANNLSKEIKKLLGIDSKSAKVNRTYKWGK
jgi:Cft2 family RNA processing exonuclease